MGRRKPGWLDYRLFFVADFVLAALLNFVLATLLRPGAVYAQYTDVFAVALITTVILWTGRRGGAVGLVALALAGAVELLKAPINHLRFRRIASEVVATRLFWAFCGWAVAAGIVRILLEYAERSERLRVGDELLATLTTSHDRYKEALRRIAHGHRGEHDHEFVDLAQTALAEPELGESPSDVRRIVSRCVRHARAAGTPQRIPSFFIVDAARTPVHLSTPAALEQVLVNLCTNASRHSSGANVTIRWTVVHNDLIMTVRDDGVGMDQATMGEGLTLAERAVHQAGGALDREWVTAGTKWKIQLPLDAASSDE